MGSAIAALAKENERLFNLVVDKQAMVDSLHERERALVRELRDLRHERDYLERKLDRATRTG